MLAGAEILTPAEREKMLASVAWEAMETDHETAHEAFAKMSPGSPEKIRLIQHYAIRLTAQNIDEAIAWADALENETETSAALSYIAVAVAETEPLLAANLLAEADLPGRDFEVAVVQVIQRWAAQSPADAAAWVGTFSPSAARKASLQAIAERWLPDDAAAAFGWMETMTETTLREEAALALQGVILQQTRQIRDAWLQHATPQIRSELEQQSEAVLKDLGDNISHPTD